MLRRVDRLDPDTVRPTAALLAGFAIAASIGAFWAVVIAMGQALRRAWPGRAR